MLLRVELPGHVGAGDHVRRLRFARELCDALGIEFSSQQLDAITAPLEPGVVIAGAGSGKTTVMAARVVWLVGTGQVRPEQVLGLTFTRKAAAELSTRVRAALQRAGAVDASGVDDAGEQLIMTYDAFAARLVNDHGLRVGVEPDARMITGAARFRLASRVVAAAPGPFRHLARLKPDSVTEQVLRLDADLTSHLAEVDDVCAESAAFVAEAYSAPTNNRRQMFASLRDAAARASERVELAGLVENFQALKRDLGAVEFADQMAVAARLARDVPDVSAALREQFTVVLLDEYQDTSSAQAELLRALFSGATPQEGRGHPVTAVGDPCQAIYGWRGAAASNIITFPASFPRADGEPALAYPLTVNRRSGQVILDAANALAASLRGDPELRWDGIDVDLVAPDGTPPGEITAATFDTQHGEVAWVADRIVASHDSALVPSWRDIAVLTRRNSTIRPLYSALVARGVPVEIVGLDGLLEVPEVADVVAMLRVLGDVTANPDVVRVLTGPRWALGPADLGQLGRRAAELSGLARPDGGDFADEVAATLAQAESAAIVSLAEALESPGERPYSDEGLRRIQACAAELRSLRRHVGEPVTDLVRRVIAALGLEVELAVRAAASPADHGARQLHAFVAAVAAYVDVDGDGSLPGLLAYLRAEAEHGAGLEQAVVSDDDSVKLMTIHKAKGLEWELVFLPSLAEGVFPGGRVTDNWLKNAGVLPAPLRGDAASVPQLVEVSDSATKAYDAALRDELRRGDDRLAYVAVTRARQHLVATTHTWAPGLSKPRAVSPYLVTLASFGELAVCEQPSATNPSEGGGGLVPWPAPVDQAAYARRREVADEIGRLRDAYALSGVMPEDRVATLDEASRVAEWDAAADRLLAEARASRSGRPPLSLPPYLSATALLALDADAEGYLSELARPMPARPVRSSRVGEAFHAWIERRFLTAPSLLGREDDADGDGADAALKVLIDRFLAGRFADRTPQAIEVPFTLFLGGQVVRGRIDAVYEQQPGPEGRWLLIDWKTGSGRRANPLQLAIYRLAWAELMGVETDRVEAAFYDVRHDELIYPASLPDRAGLEAEVTRLVAAH